MSDFLRFAESDYREHLINLDQVTNISVSRVRQPARSINGPESFTIEGVSVAFSDGSSREFSDDNATRFLDALHGHRTRALMNSTPAPPHNPEP